MVQKITGNMSFPMMNPRRKEAKQFLMTLT